MESSKRSRVRKIFFCLVFFYSIVLFRVYMIQIRSGDFYRTKAVKQYCLKNKITPSRELIYDRNNKPLVLNSHKISAFITSKKVLKSVKVHSFLKKNFPAAMARLEQNPGSQFLFLKRDLSKKEIELIKESGIKEIYLIKGPSRFYPAEYLGHIVGVTDNENQGLFGIEHIYNKRLAGEPSIYALEKDARSGFFYFKKETKKTGFKGKPVKITVDSTLQFLVQEELKETVDSINAKEAAAIILNPTTGDILAMSQYPGFDPNNRAKIEIKNINNKILTESYELGSVIKVFLGLAALEEGVVEADELIDCENKKSTIIDEMKIGTHKAHGLLTFSQLIEFSNNIGTSKVAKRLGRQLYDHYKSCGFGEKTSINWPGEQSGFVNPPYLWSKASVLSLSFGYEIRATLLQLALAYSLLANEGRIVEPRLILEKSNARPKFSKPIYGKSTIEEMRKILNRTVESGTARRARIKECQIFGKTGTARLLVDGQYSQERKIFTFMGLVEKENYKRIIVTFVKESQKKSAMASTTAAPLFKKIAKKMLIRDKKLNIN